MTGLVELYESWHAAEPTKGYDVKGDEWRGKLAAWQAATQPATPQAVSPPVAATDSKNDRQAIP